MLDSARFGFLFFVFPDRVSSLYSPGCLGTHSVEQAGLKLTELYLLLPLGCWDKKHVSPLPLSLSLSRMHNITHIMCGHTHILWDHAQS